MSFKATLSFAAIAAAAPAACPEAAQIGPHVTV